MRNTACLPVDRWGLEDSVTHPHPQPRFPSLPASIPFPFPTPPLSRLLMNMFVITIRLHIDVKHE